MRNYAPLLGRAAIYLSYRPPHPDRTQPADHLTLVTTPTPSRTLDTHASRLRTKLQLGQFHGDGQIYQLSAIYGLGYRLEILAAPEKVAEPA